MSISILSLLDLSIHSKDTRGLSRTSSSRREHNAVKLMTMLKGRVIKSSSVIGCENEKKKFAIRTCSGKMFL